MTAIRPDYPVLLVVTHRPVQVYKVVLLTTGQVSIGACAVVQLRDELMMLP